MPELPEVETVARGLRTLVGRRVAGVELRHRGIYRGDPATLSTLEGAVLRGVDRGGKYLVLQFETAAGVRWQMLIHLGMTGQLVLSTAAQARALHTHFVLQLHDGAELHFRDPRRFGRIAFAPAPPGGFAVTFGVATGIEPLLATVGDFTALFHRRQAPIKNALLNQKLLRGLGNIYADESLFRAGIHPRARTLSRPRLARLRLAVRAVLREAIAAGGSSVSDYIAMDGSKGWFQIRHRVYGRAGQPCVVCGRPIQRIVLAGRSAHFCKHCQTR